MKDAAEVARDVIDKAANVAFQLTQTAEALEKQDKRNIEVVSQALRDVFNENVDTKRFVDVSRIPLICQNILGIDKRLNSIEGNLTWGVRIIVGAVILSLLTLIVK